MIIFFPLRNSVLPICYFIWFDLLKYSFVPVQPLSVRNDSFFWEMYASLSLPFFTLVVKLVFCFTFLCILTYIFDDQSHTMKAKKKKLKILGQQTEVTQHCFNASPCMPPQKMTSQLCPTNRTNPTYLSIRKSCSLDGNVSLIYYP